MTSYSCRCLVLVMIVLTGCAITPAEDREVHGIDVPNPTVVISSESALLELVVDMTLDSEGNLLLLDWNRAAVVIDGGWVLRTNDGLLRPFGRQVVSMITTHGHVVSGHNDDYSLEYSDGGEVLFRVEREWEPIPLHPEERAQWVARQAFISQPIPASVPVNAPLNPKYPPIPETKPAIVGLWPGEDGTVWVQRYTVAHERTDLPTHDADDDRPRLTWWQYPTFDVFSPEADFLGTVTMPHGAQIALFHSDYIWTVRPDEHGEDTAVRFRIVKGGDGL